MALYGYATRFQLYLAATVPNLTLVAAKAGLPEDTGGASKVGSAPPCRDHPFHR